MPPMTSIVFAELPAIEKIIADETWLEGERRGCPVPPDDPVVVERVCEIVLRIGQKLREHTQARLQEDIIPLPHAA